MTCTMIQILDLGDLVLMDRFLYYLFAVFLLQNFFVVSLLKIESRSLRPVVEIIQYNHTALVAIFNMQVHFMSNRNVFWH